MNEEQISNYLNIKKEGMDVLQAISSVDLKFHEVSKDVNKPINNDASLIKSIT
jgi:putative SOS response-associated peptidase YedK